MPDRTPLPAERYRCTFLYGDHVLPPAVPGERALQGWFPDREAADMCIEEGTARKDLGRMRLEQCISEPGQRQEWGLLHEWVVTPDGWQIAE